ncbi:MAG TPA: nucleotidyltransferase family protein, partial [Candidatus Sumerlaeota bacterium]|nr:nucleotidyltransferase family protein [Candidatus Sumerlaeota bacterium]
MKAIVLAGGKGTRLKPYTTALPKPLMPIGDKPVLELVLLHLRKYGITNVTLAVNHLAELIRAFFGDGSRWDITLRYSVEDRPLSTVSPLRILDEELPGTFIVMNGDVITDLNMLELLRSHESSGALLTV